MQLKNCILKGIKIDVIKILGQYDFYLFDSDELESRLKELKI